MPDNYQRKPATRIAVQDAWARQYVGFLDRLAWHTQHARVRGAVVDRQLRRLDPFWADRAEMKSPRERWRRLSQRMADASRRARQQANARERARRRTGCGAGD